MATPLEKHFHLISAASYLCLLGSRTGYVISLKWTTFLVSPQPVSPETPHSPLLYDFSPKALDLPAAKSQGLSCMLAPETVSALLLQT